MKPAIRSASFHTFYLMQEYNIIGKKESILLLSPGFMTFGVIYTCLRYHRLLFMGVLASLYGIYNTTTVTTVGM